MTPSVVLVTGGTGFIGRRLVERLLQDGHRVRVFGRSAAACVRHPAPHNLEPIAATITDADAVSGAARGADTVFHLAGCAKAWSADPNEFHDVNVKGTEHIVAACAHHDVRRLVHFSTALVDRPDRLITAYQRTKLDGERVVRQTIETTTAVIVRPTRVYGPGLLSVANSVTTVIDMYRKGRFRLRIADKNALANYVFVDDVVEAALLASQHTTPTGEPPVFTLGGENATMAQFLDTVATITGQHRFVAAIPQRIARMAGAIAVGLARFGIAPLITPQWVDLLSRDWAISSDRARRDLGYDPRGILAGIQETLAWLEQSSPTTSPIWRSA